MRHYCDHSDMQEQQPNPNHLNADQAREHIKAGGMVKDRQGDKWRMKCGTIQCKREDGWCRLSEDTFECSVPFTIHETKRELRSRAEKAEARVKALEHDAYAVGYNAGVAKMQDQLATVTAERDEARKENDTLRGIVANADLPCVYCGLSRADMSKCASGFPGCARGDDIMCAPEEKT